MLEEPRARRRTARLRVRWSRGPTARGCAARPRENLADPVPGSRRDAEPTGGIDRTDTWRLRHRPPSTYPEVNRRVTCAPVLRACDLADSQTSGFGSRA